jgi:hypothetical protein
MAKRHNWSCRAGSRYLYICEDGLVHYCSQQRGYPGIPLSQYTPDHLKMEFNTKKYCAPYCTVACVHTISGIDNWRGEQTERAFRPTRIKPQGQEKPEPISPLADLPPAFE